MITMEPEKKEPFGPPPVDPNQHQPLHLEPIVPAKKRKRWPFVALFFLLLVALGFGAYSLGSKKPVAEAPTAETTQTEQATTSEQDTPNTTETKEYSNGFMGVKLTHSTAWTVIESSNGDSVKLESPNFSYETKSKGTVIGNFRIYIRKGARAVDSPYIGRGFAFQPSDILVYTKPAPGQRADTYLSLFGLDKPDNFGFFLIAGNYNLEKGDTLGPDYGKEAETYIIAGGFSSKDLKDDLATNAVDTELVNTSNAYKQAIEILKSLQLR